MAISQFYTSLQNRTYNRNLQVPYEDLGAKHCSFQEVEIGAGNATLTSCTATKIHTLYGTISAQNCHIQTYLGGSGVDLTDCQGDTVSVEAGRATIRNTPQYKRVSPKDFLSIEAPVSIALENVWVEKVHCSAGSIEARNSQVDVVKAQDTIHLVDSIAASILFSVVPGRIYDLHLEGTSRVIGPILLQRREEQMVNHLLPLSFANTLKQLGKEKIADREDLESKNHLPKDPDFPFKQVAPVPRDAQEEPVTLRIHGGSRQEQVHFIGCTGEISRLV